MGTMYHISTQLLIKAIDHLETVCNHADEDCPSEYRSKHFNPSIQDARDFLHDAVKQLDYKEGKG